MPFPTPLWRRKGAEKAETPGGWAGIGRSVCDFAPHVNQRRRAKTQGTKDAGIGPTSRPAFVGKASWTILGGVTLKPSPWGTWTVLLAAAIEQDATIGEATMFPLPPLLP